MKHIIALVMTALMAFVLTACSEQPAPKQPQVNNQTTTVPAPAPAEHTQQPENTAPQH